MMLGWVRLPTMGGLIEFGAIDDVGDRDLRKIASGSP